MTARSRAVRLQRFLEEDWSLTMLLVFLSIAVFLVRPLEAIGVNLHLSGAIAFTVILLTGIFRVMRSRITMIVFGSLAVVAASIHWARFAIYGAAWTGIDAVASLLACGMLAAIVLMQVFAEGPITSQRIQGAIAAYLLVALMFAAAYTLISARIPNAFAGVIEPAGHDPMQRFVYFSFVTLTTTGYGDVTPVAAFARSLAMLEAVLGQLFPSILLARLVSMELYYRQRRFDREQAVLDRRELAREVAALLHERHE